MFTLITIWKQKQTRDEGYSRERCQKNNWLIKRGGIERLWVFPPCKDKRTIKVHILALSYDYGTLQNLWNLVIFYIIYPTSQYNLICGLIEAINNHWSIFIFCCALIDVKKVE